jgi:hypothetical protein
MPLVPSDPRARRVLMAGGAGLLLTLPVLAHDSLSGRLLAGWLAVFVGFVLAMAALDSRRVPGRLATLAGAAVIGATAAATVVLLISSLSDTPSATALHCRDDVSAATFGAAAELRAGHNPYASYDTLRV